MLNLLSTMLRSSESCYILVVQDVEASVSGLPGCCVCHHTGIRMLVQQLNRSLTFSSNAKSDFQKVRRIF